METICVDESIIILQMNKLFTELSMTFNVKNKYLPLIAVAKAEKISLKILEYSIILNLAEYSGIF